MEAVKSFSLTSFVTPQREILSSKPRAAIWALSWFVNSRSMWVYPHVSISHSGNSVFNRENALMSRSCCFWLQALPMFTILKLFASDVSLFCVTAFGMYIILVLGNIFVSSSLYSGCKTWIASLDSVDVISFLGGLEWKRMLGALCNIVAMGISPRYIILSNWQLSGWKATAMSGGAGGRVLRILCEVARSKR